jgi:hypothetical protein
VRQQFVNKNNNGFLSRRIERVKMTVVVCTATHSRVDRGVFADDGGSRRCVC